MSVLVALAAATALQTAGPEQPPSEPPKSGIVACAQIDDDGNVSKVFVVVSSGNADQDATLLNDIKQLHWDKVPRGTNPSRNIWLPIGFALNGATPPPSPSSCAPPPNV